MKTSLSLPSALCSLLFLAVMVSACSSNPPVTAAPGEADELLLERGNAALKERSWTRARTYFSELLESYPQSPLRADAKLGVGDTFLGENNSASYVYAQNEYREFLAFYPTNPARRLRADAARHGALQPDAEPAARPDGNEGGDQGVPDLRRSLSEQQADHAGEAAAARGEGSAVGLRTWWSANFYLSIRLYAGAEPRYRHVLETDPEYTRKDSLYFHLAETLEKSE